MKKNLIVVLAILVAGIAAYLGGSAIYKKQNETKLTDAISGAPARASMETLVKPWSPTLGPSMARVVIVEFLDPECEACRAMHPFVKSILKDYDGRVHYVLRYMPFHQNSELAASWLEAAGEQGRYWEALDILFANQPQWADHHQPRPELIPALLGSIGINVAAASKARTNPEIATRIQTDKTDGTSVGVDATPTFFVNGKKLENLGDAPLRALIDEELAGAK